MKLLLAVILLAALGTGYAYFLAPSEQPLEVRTVTPTTEDITLVLEETGRVVNDRIVKLTALVDGQLASTRFNVGDHVSANEVVATFDAQEAEALYAKAQAEVERERAAADKSHSQLRRLERLAASSSSTEQARDDARYEHQSAIAKLSLAQANLRLYDIKRKETVLATPYAGIVIEKSSEAGQWMEAGTLLYKLVADEGFEIEAFIDAAELTNVEVGLEAALYLEEAPEARWRAPIHWISPSVLSNDQATDNSFAVRLPVNDDAPPLLLNQQVELSIDLRHAPKTTVIPAIALLSDTDGDEIALIVNGKVERVPVELGIETIDRVQVISGVAPGDVVIVPGGLSLANGQTVRARGARSDSAH